MQVKFYFKVIKIKKSTIDNHNSTIKKILEFNNCRIFKDLKM